MMKTTVTIFDCPECAPYNADLVKAILGLDAQSFRERTHLFHGRYENLYIDANKLPGLEFILQQGLQKAAAILGRKAEQLKMGFWLNVMQEGDVTTLHRHDDDDELLSAVYYIQADEGSAVFRLHDKDEIIEIVPVAGRFMFFDPALPHEVTRHQANKARISVGINFGPAD